MRYAKLSAIVLFVSCLPACAAGPAEEDDEGFALEAEAPKGLEQALDHIATEREIAVFAAFRDADRAVPCRGVLIAPEAVLVEAHCVYDEERGGAASAVRVGSSAGERLFVPAGFRNAANAWDQKLHDYAVVRTAVPLIERACPGLHGCMANDELLVPLDEYEDDLTYGTIKSWALRPRTW